MKRTAIIIAFLFVATALFAAEQQKGCKMGDTSQAKSVELTGKLLCKHCDLHQSDTCEKVFQTADAEKTTYAVCQHSKVDLEKLSDHGASTLRVKGKIVKCQEEAGKEELLIEDAAKVEAGS